MSQKSVPFLLIRVGRSKNLILLNLLIHGLAVVASATNALPWWPRILIFIGVLVSLYFSSKRYGLFDNIPCIEIGFIDGKGWSIRLGDDDYPSVALLPSSVVTPWITILHFKTEKKVIPVLVLQDSLGKEDFRQLRVFAKIVG